MLINYDHYRVFHHVVQNGSITGAAKELYLSQSTVSRIIKNLESSLDSVLLERSKKGVKLTEEGVLLFSHLNTAVEHISIAEERLESLKRSDAGRLRIGSSELALEYFLLPYLRMLKAERRNFTVGLSYTTPVRANEDLRSGIIDIAVLASPIPAHEDIKVITLKEVNYILVAGSSFSELQNKKTAFSELKGYPFIAGEKGMAVRLFADRIAKASGFELEPKYELASLPLLISMVEMDFGIGFVPYQHAEKALFEKRIFRIDLEQELPIENICVMLAKTPYSSRITNIFLDTLLSGH